MRIQNVRKTLLVGLVASTLVLFSGGLALAAKGDTIPHGGHNTATDACLQCHDVHQSAGDYVLGRFQTVTAVCGSCHTLYQQTLPFSGGSLVQSTDPVWATQVEGDAAGLTDYGGSPTEDANTMNTGSAGSSVYINYNPGYSGLEAPVPGWYANGGNPTNQVGNGSPYEVYEKPLSAADGSDGRRGHRLGSVFTLGASIMHGDGVTDALDYIPGSTSRLTAIGTPSVADSATDIGYGYMLPTVSVSEFPVSLNGGLYCASCHSPHGQLSGQGYDGAENNSNMISPEIIDKLLSKRPNHSGTEANLDPANGDQWITDGAEWCGKCHDQRRSNTVGIDPHNHPDFACLQCHGNESVIAANNPEFGQAHLDFPHTSANPNLLTQEPDGLCLNCHSPGALPLP